MDKIPDVIVKNYQELMSKLNIEETFVVDDDLNEEKPRITVFFYVKEVKVVILIFETEVILLAIDPTLNILINDIFCIDDDISEEIKKHIKYLENL